MNHTADDHQGLLYVIIVFSFVLVAVVHFLPAIIAFGRGHQRRMTILFLNVILGWTGVVWLYLLLMALELF